MKSKNIFSFNFHSVSVDKEKDIIKALNTKKASPDEDREAVAQTCSVCS